MRPDEWKDRLGELVQKAGIFKIIIVILSGILLIFLSWGGMSERGAAGGKGNRGRDRDGTGK